MPGRDKTGPFGQGPMTGRGAGNCATVDVSQPVNAGYQRGFGCGWGIGRGPGRGRNFGRGGGQYWSHPAYGVYDGADVGNQESFRDEITTLVSRIEELNERLSKLEKTGNEQ